MPKRLSMLVHRLQSGWMPYLVLLFILVTTYFVLATRGFRLGFYGDVVSYQWHYTYDGIFGGMNWLITQHWERHLLGALFSAPLEIFVPRRYELWYAFALGLHMILGMIVFLLVDTLQQGERRWLAFAVALLFVFDMFQTPSNFQFATGSHRKGSLILALLSLWSYIHYIRCQRTQISWYIINVTCFLLAIMIYEQSFFFFVLHPLIVVMEERRAGRFKFNLQFIWTSIRDSFIHVVIVFIYVYLLLSLFTGGSDGLELTPSHILRQIIEGITFHLNPIEIGGRLAEAITISQIWILLLFAGLISVFFGAWITLTDDDTTRSNTSLWIAFFGLILMLMNILNASPTIWHFNTHSRLIYASSVGSSMVIVGSIAWFMRFNRLIGGLVVTLILTILLAPSISFLFEHQVTYRERDDASTIIYQSIYDAIPEFTNDAVPYLLILSDLSTEEMSVIHPQDFNFQRVFALHYGIKEFRADTVLFDIEDASVSQQITLMDEGIISPLRPNEVIDYDRVIIIEYASQTQSIQVIDQLSNDVLSDGNFNIQADVDIVTNFDLLPEDE